MDKFDGVDTFCIVISILSIFLVISIAVGFIKELIRDKKYNKIIIPLVVIVLIIAGGFQKISEIVEDAEREYEFKKTLPSEVIKAEKYTKTYGNAGEFNVDSVPDDDNTYKPGTYTIGYSVEPGLYSIHREGGHTWIYIDNTYKPIEEHINTHLYEGEVLKVPEGTVIKMYRIGE